MTEEHLPKYLAIQKAAKAFTDAVLENTPEGDDQDSAIYEIRKAVLSANKAVASDGKGFINRSVGRSVVITKKDDLVSHK